MTRTATGATLAILDKLEPEAKAGWEAEELNLAEAIQGLVHHMRQEQQMIRDWAEAQAEQNTEIRKVLDVLSREKT